MLNRRKFILGLALCAGLFTLQARAQEASLRIEGIGADAVVLSAADLKGLKRVNVDDKRKMKGKESVVHYGGVLLSDVLERAGFAKLDPHTRRRCAVIAIAGDGYEAAYSWGEVFNSPAGDSILVMDQREGQPMNAEDGPLAIAALADSNPSPRHVKRLLVLRLIQGVKP